MSSTTSQYRSNRIFYPRGSWFPLQKEVFKSVFPGLKEKRSAHLYMAMYEHARRHPSKPFAAALTELAKMIDCDTRTARRCIVELVGEGSVTMVEGGKTRSRTDKATFTVPLASKKLAPGGWFPVPRFLVTQYLKKFEGGIVLIALLDHQHMKWKSDCWPGVERLSTVLGMKKRRVFAYLNKMGHQANWKRLHTGLPWPLEISYSADGSTRHFSVRAVRFYTPQGKKKPVVKLAEEFAIYFGFAKGLLPTKKVHSDH